jgi:release factor glutamine methyltransferase
MFVFCIECPYCVDISLDIVGEWPFGCLPEPVLLKEPILIPRPETEELVEHIRNQYEADMQSMGEQGGRDFCFLEVGSGTGVISLSLLEKNPSWRGVAIDINPTAVELTCANAARMGVSSRLTVLHMDALQPDMNALRLAAQLTSSGGHCMPAPPSPKDPLFHMVVSNPPYIPTGDILC